MSRMMTGSPDPSSLCPARSGIGGRRGWSRGFTLVELLVSLVLFAILGVLVASALQSAITSYEVTRHSTGKLSQLSLTEELMQRDFSQIQPRPTVGSSNLMSAAVYFPTVDSLEITTASRSNPGGLLARSNLQQVRYTLENNQLLRTTWPQLDGRLDNEAVREVLLTQVASLQFTLIDESGNRKDTWSLSNQSNDDQLPAAVLIDIIFQNETEFHGSFAVTHQQQGGKQS